MYAVRISRPGPTAPSPRGASARRRADVADAAAASRPSLVRVKRTRSIIRVGPPLRGPGMHCTPPLWWIGRARATGPSGGGAGLRVAPGAPPRATLYDLCLTTAQQHATLHAQDSESDPEQPLELHRMLYVHKLHVTSAQQHAARAGLRVGPGPPPNYLEFC